MSSMFFHRMVFNFERRDATFFIIPDCTPGYRMHKYIQDTYSFSQITCLSIVDSQLKLSPVTLGQILNVVTHLRHLHLNFAEEHVHNRRRFERDILSIIEIALTNNKDTLESLSLNTCSTQTLDVIRKLPMLKVLVLTLPDMFDIMDFKYMSASGGWLSLEVVVIDLINCFQPFRPQFVDKFLHQFFPNLVAISITGSPPNQHVFDFLNTYDYALERVAFLTPDEQTPFHLPYNFCFPEMPNVTQLSITSRHLSHFSKIAQPNLDTLILYDEELPVAPFVKEHVQFVHRTFFDVPFPKLEYIILRSTIDSTFEMCFYKPDLYDR